MISNSSHPVGGKIGHDKPNPSRGKATAVFKQSFNIGALSEEERAMARAMLQRLAGPAPAPVRPRP